VVRGGELTQRLLSFSRQQPPLPHTVDLAPPLTGLTEVSRSSLPENVAIEYRFPDDLWPVTVDAGQVETAILNLVLNAPRRHAGRGHVYAGSRQLGHCPARDAAG
jgi:signal transduction histidine kinase